MMQIELASMSERYLLISDFPYFCFALQIRQNEKRHFDVMVEQKNKIFYMSRLYLQQLTGTYKR